MSQEVVRPDPGSELENQAQIGTQTIRRLERLATIVKILDLVTEKIQNLKVASLKSSRGLVASLGGMTAILK